MPCPDLGRLQDFLEGLLSPADMRVMDEHIRECALCATRRERLERVFGALTGMPLATPAIGLRERVLDDVLPARRRTRWLRRFGWGYAGALAACLVAIAGWMALPGGRVSLAWILTEASDRLLHSMLFVIQTASFVALGLATSWGVLAGLVSGVSPLLRAAAIVATHPGVDLALVLAAVTCASVLWWIRSRGRSRKGMRHVGILGV